MSLHPLFLTTLSGPKVPTAPEGQPASPPTGGPPGGDGPPRFLCDGMLGHVTRWLRIAGYDTVYAQNERDDAGILAQALREGRVLLTRDADLHQRARARDHPCLLLEAGGAAETLARVLAALGVAPEHARWFTRCTRCNGDLAPASPESVREEVPPLVLERHERFHRCTACGHVYWEGTHVAQMRDVLASLSRDAAGQD